MQPLQFPAQDVQDRRGLVGLRVDLALVFGLAGNAELFEKIHGRGDRKARKDSRNKSRVAAVETGKRAIGVAQVAAAVAGGQQFLADPVQALQQNDCSAAAGGADGGHQTRTAAADHGHLGCFSHGFRFSLQ